MKQEFPNKTTETINCMRIKLKAVTTKSKIVSGGKRESERNIEME